MSRIMALNTFRGIYANEGAPEVVLLADLLMRLIDRVAAKKGLEG